MANGTALLYPVLRRRPFVSGPDWLRLPSGGFVVTTATSDAVD